MDRLSRQKINKKTVALDKINLTDVYTEHSIQNQNTPSSQEHMEHFPGKITCKVTSLKFKKTEIVSRIRIFFDHDGMKIEISNKKTGKNTNTWKLNNMLLDNQWINEQVKEDITRIHGDK